MARASDALTIDRLLTQFAHHLNEPQSYKGTADILRASGLGDNERFSVLLAECQEQPAGLTVFYPEFSTWRCAPGVYIQDLFVESKWQGLGLGKRLLASSVLAAQSQWGCQYLKLSVGVANQSAQGFYKKIGMIEDSENHVMVLEGEHFNSLVGHK